MAILFVLLAVAALCALLTAPLPVRARAYLTLDGFRLHVRLRVAGIVPVHARVVLKEGNFVFTLNGKPPKKRRKRPSPKIENVLKAAGNLLRDGVLRGGNAAFFVGGEDSARGALAVGLLSAVAAALGQSGRTAVYWDSDNPAFVFDCGVRARISLVQTAVALVTALSDDGRGKEDDASEADGRKRETRETMRDKAQAR